MSCCEHGKMTLTVDGQIISARGEFTISPTNFEREGGLNEDGTIWSTYKPVPATAEGSIDACTGDITSLWEKCNFTVTFEFAKAGSYVFSNARMVGKPELNSGTGEVSGFKIISPQAKKVG